MPKNSDFSLIEGCLKQDLKKGLYIDRSYYLQFSNTAVKVEKKVFAFDAYVCSKYFKKTLWPLFMDRDQLSPRYRVTKRRQFTFYHSIFRTSWYSFN